MRDAPSKILLIVAPDVTSAKDWAYRAGLSAAMALGRVRVITRAPQLRGWRAGTLFRSVGWTGEEPEAGAMSTVLNAMTSAGTLHLAGAAEVESFMAEVVG